MNEYVLRNFRFNHPYLAEQMVDCYDAKFGEIIVYLKDGKRVLYTDIDQRVRVLPDNSRELLEEEIVEEFGHRLRYLMKVRRMSQLDLSYATGFTQPAISKYVRGLTMPSMYTLHKLAQALNCSVEDLMYVD